MNETTVLFRPVGQKEWDLIAEFRPEQGSQE